jgi:hypothetical protein
LQDILIGPGVNGYWDLLKNTGSGFSRHDNFIDLHGSATTTTGQGACTSWQTTKGGTTCMAYETITTTNYTIITSTGLTTNSTCAPATKGSQCPSQILSYSHNSDKARNIRLVDVNGDGLQDIVSGPRSDNKWYVFINTGAGFNPPGNSWYTGFSYWENSVDRVFPTDVNGDGKVDFVIGPNPPKKPLSTASLRLTKP